MPDAAADLYKSRGLRERNYLHALLIFDSAYSKKDFFVSIKI